MNSFRSGASSTYQRVLIPSSSLTSVPGESSTGGCSGSSNSIRPVPLMTRKTSSSLDASVPVEVPQVLAPVHSDVVQHGTAVYNEPYV